MSQWIWGPLIAIGIPVAMVGLMVLIAKLINRPRVNKKVQIMRLIEKPAMEARRAKVYSDLWGEWTGWCTLCNNKVSKYPWQDWEMFKEHEYDRMLGHECPTVEEVIKSAPKWERVTASKGRGKKK